MNKQRRAALEKLHTQLTDLQQEIVTLRDEEQDYFDNMPENMQPGEKGQASESAIDALDSAVSSCDDVLGYIDEVTRP